jgi:uncharacterized protein YggU (UPF0235/DUF167 family)
MSDINQMTEILRRRDARVRQKTLDEVAQVIEVGTRLAQEEGKANEEVVKALLNLAKIIRRDFV